MNSSSAFKSLQERISSSLIDTTRTAGHIAAEDLSFHRSLSASIASKLDRQNGRLLDITGKLTKAAVLNSEVNAPQLNSLDAVEENWQGVVDVIDCLLEKADACLDEYTGVVKRLSPTPPEQTPTSTVRGTRPTRSFRDQDIPKPQLLFAKVPRNDESTPFKPLLRSKPHAILPLDQSLEMIDNDEGRKQYKHPYETEIIQHQYPPPAYAQSEPIPYHSFEATKAIFVDTPEGLTAMVSELITAKEIAVDLEHHDTHSYIGLVSLMQISTRDRDWVVDTLKPWRDQLQILNEVFADPRILKVFHGAFMDMMWLQRDLGLYVVGLFDTFHASKALGYPKKSLASLLDKFASFKADKSYQTADWRIRPLPQEMLDYARSDTHYLLFVYDNLRNELIQRSAATKGDDHLVDVVLQKSKEEALQRFEWPFYDPVRGLGSNGWYRLLDRTPALFSKEQFAVFKAVHQWRDAVAREEDESLHHVMPKHVMFSIATSMPMDMPSLLGVSHPISQPMRSRAGQLLEIVKKAKEAGVDGPEMIDVLVAPETRAENSLITGSSSIVQDPSVHVDAAGRTPIGASGELPYRSNSTRFWGSIFGSSLWHAPTSGATTAQDLCFAIPLPQLTAEVFHSGNNRVTTAGETSTEDRGTPTEHQYHKASDSTKPRDDGIFVIKDMGGSRKRRLNDTQDGAHTAALQGDDSAAEQTEIRLEDEEAQNRALRKGERKARKKLKKEQAEGLNGASTSQGNEPDESRQTEPFDYANAESVLHAKRDFNDRGAPKKKVFDRYAKSMDAPKGMRKTKREVVGRSFTFKE